MGCPTPLSRMPKLDFSNYEGGREQAYVKHYLLQTYLPELAYRIGRTWDSFAYIDGFAGPWKTHDPEHADSSFGVAIDALRRSQQGLRATHDQDLHITCVLVEKDKVAFAELERLAASETSPDFAVHALHGDFVKNIPAVDHLVKESGKNPFKFVLLDPTGWADIPMDKESIRYYLVSATNHPRGVEVFKAAENTAAKITGQSA